jgi:diguanylate cyclase
MHFLVIDILYGAIMTAAGSAVTWWLCRPRVPEIHPQVAESHHAAEILTRLQDLTRRVAIQVDEHTSQVAEINNSLTSADHREPTIIVDMVAKLIEVNQHMQDKLASTEDKLREQAEEIQTHAAEARTDALTLLANRRALDDELARRIAEFRRRGRTFALIMADIDRFKNFNDTYGHLAGDEVLRGVAKVFRRKMRDMDLVARYGGEEFAIILPEMTLSEASNAALRACEAIANAHFRYDTADLQVTTSLGVAQVLDDEEGVELVARADKALYAAKQGGRNRIYRHDGETVQQVAASEAPRQEDQHARPRQAAVAADADGPKREIALPHPEVPETIPGLLTRSAFCQQVRNRTAEWKRGGPTFSVILIEVNQNNGDAKHHHGRHAREFAVLAATRFLAATIREMDAVGHYAPSCFALLLPAARLADAIPVAERLREGFSQYNEATQDGQPKLAVSVGVVQVMEKDDSVLLLKRAEAALDAADCRGGNRAFCHDGVRCAPINTMLETIDYLR